MLIIIREGGRSFLEDLGRRGPTWVSELHLDFMPNVCFVDSGSSPILGLWWNCQEQRTRDQMKEKTLENLNMFLVVVDRGVSVWVLEWDISSHLSLPLSCFPLVGFRGTASPHTAALS